MVRVFILITVLASTSVLGQGWQRITPPYSVSWDPGEEGLDESYFWSVDQGFVGNFLTSDGGASWYEIELPTVRADRSYNTSRRNFFAVSDSDYFSVSTTLIITGPYYFEDWTYGAILHTKSAGDQDWRIGDMPGGCVGAGRLWFKNPRNGFAYLESRGCGEGPYDMIGVSVPLFTTNGGRWWQSIFDILPEGDKYSILFEFYGGDFVNDTTFVFSFDTSLYLIHFTDTLRLTKSFSIPGNKTRLPSLLISVNDSLFFLSRNKQLFRSTNRGGNWAVVIDSCEVIDIAFKSDSTLYAILKKDGWSSIYKSADAGLTWRAQLLSSGTNFVTISAASDSVAYVFGTNGIAYKTTDGGGTTLAVSKPHALSDGEITAYPNPSTDQITIRYANNASQLLFLYDELGREVYRLKLDENDDQVHIIVSRFRSGSYTARVGSRSVRFIVAH